MVNVIDVPAITDGDQWMKPKEAAAYVRSTPGSLATMRGEGKGPRYFKPRSRMILYRKSDLDAWLMGGETA